MNLNLFTFKTGAAGHLLTQHTFRWLSVSLWLARQTESVTRITQGKKKSRENGIVQENNFQTAGSLMA